MKSIAILALLFCSSAFDANAGIIVYGAPAIFFDSSGGTTIINCGPNQGYCASIRTSSTPGVFDAEGEGFLLKAT